MNDLDRQQRLFVAAMAEKLRLGGIGRRQFLRAAASAGFGFASARYLAGSAPAGARLHAAEPTVAESGMTNEQRQFLVDAGKRFKGTRIKVVSENTPPGLSIGRMIREEFTPLTGIEVDWPMVPLDQVLAKTVQDTIAGADGTKGHYDIFYWDQAWLARFANESIGVEELLDRKELAYPGYDFGDFLPQLVEGTASHGGRIIGVPFDIPIFIMMYRKDILAELRLEVPKTMGEYLDTVRAIDAAKRGQGIHGTVGQWKTGHFSLQCDASAWIWAHGGHHFSAENRPDYVTEGNANGLEYMLELGKHMSPDVREWDWDGQAAALTQGRGIGPQDRHPHVGRVGDFTTVTLPGDRCRAATVIDGDNQTGLVAVLGHKLQAFPKIAQKTIELVSRSQIPLVLTFMGPIIGLTVGDIEGARFDRVDGMERGIPNKGI